uniref:DNA-directed DNA polymerase n=1 Tax=Sipha flava TaxID=143950 RepID=A0A2S2R0A9_9HEMI
MELHDSGICVELHAQKKRVKLELLTDYDMHLFIEKGLRGGMTQCSVRYSKANNKYMDEKFNKNKKSVYSQYLDANNLYEWAMSQYLPSGGFKWLYPSIITDILNLDVNSPRGYIFEVDLTYPQELHDKHSDFPLAPENQFDGVKLPKLTLNLYYKKEYVVHYITLQEYIRDCLRVEEIHKILEFDQSS